MRIAFPRAAFVASMVLLALPGFPTAAEPETPKLTARVTDQPGLLTSDENRSLTRMLDDYERETTHQVAVLIVRSLAGESIDSMGLRVANEAGLGRRNVDNGILVVVAPVERKVRIELGRGFERYISNAQAADIIRDQMAPRFRENRYAQGLDDGLRELMRQGRAFVAPAKRVDEPRRTPAQSWLPSF